MKFKIKSKTIRTTKTEKYYYIYVYHFKNKSLNDQNSVNGISIDLIKHYYKVKEKIIKEKLKECSAIIDTIDNTHFYFRKTNQVLKFLEFVESLETMLILNL